VGAKRRDILIQFLIEAAVLSVTGGVMGILLGWGASGLFTGLNLGFKAVFSLDAVILAFTISAAIGIFFGLYPATRAARLHPIEALRYE
jgi:ABC-type antimicrobial peptide transport system permease subunit